MCSVRSALAFIRPDFSSHSRFKTLQLLLPVFLIFNSNLRFIQVRTYVILVSLCPEHSIAETITVALRVAEEAIDEAISKAEFDTTSQVIY